MNRLKIVTLVSVIACIVLSSSLVGVVLNCQAMIQQKDQEYRDLLSQLLNATLTSYGYWENLTLREKPGANLTAEQTDFLADNAELYQSLLNGVDPHTLKFVILHASEKSESENITIPDVNFVYQKLREGFAGYEVLILPEYMGNLNWPATIQWISTNFTGIPICLSVFEGGNESFPYPNVNLNVTQIKQAMEAANVKMVRFSEMVSWYMENNQTLPTAQVKEILDFCRSKNLKVIWSEWKISDDVWENVTEAFAGYDDIVTYVYQTNNEYDDPFIGYLHASQFEHWGASVQSWYWYTIHNKTEGYERLMPPGLFINHTKLARNLGAEIIQFEPYWYFFTDTTGAPREIMDALWELI